MTVVLEVGDETLVSVALEVVQHQNVFAMLDDTSVVGAQLPALRDPKVHSRASHQLFPRHTKRHAPRGVPEPSAVPGGNLCRDGPLSRLTALSLPRPGRWDEQRALEDDAKRNLAAIRHDSKTECGALIRLSCGVPNTKRGEEVSVHSCFISMWGRRPTVVITSTKQFMAPTRDMRKDKKKM